MRPFSMASLTRRAFLIGAAAFAPVAKVTARQAGAVTETLSLDEFMRLSRRLVGDRQLDAQAGAMYFNALLAVPENRPRLVRLAHSAGGDLDAAHSALEATIIEWWYTGVYTLRGERRVATHTNALMWVAMGIRAPGACATAFGAWTRPPRIA
jgi:hypothetical protein